MFEKNKRLTRRAGPDAVRGAVGGLALRVVRVLVMRERMRGVCGVRSVRGVRRERGVRPQE